MTRRVALAAAVMLMAACSADTTATTTSVAPQDTVTTHLVHLALDSIAMQAGDSVIPTVMVTIDGNSRPATPSEIRVASSDTGVIAVASNGALLGLTDGISSITVTWVATPAVAAVEAVHVISETLTRVSLVAPLAMIPGDTATFVVTGTTRFGRQVTQPASVTVVSRNSAVVAANGNQAIAIAPGTTWIVARASTGASDSSFVTVAVGAPVTLTLSPHTASLVVGHTLQAVVAMADRRGNTVTSSTPAWSTSASAIATVQGGLVTAKGAGSTQVIASINGVADTLNLTVTGGVQAPVLATLTATPTTVTMHPGDTVRIVAQAFDTHGNPMALPAVTWTSMTAGISVSTTGLISAASSITTSIANGVVWVARGNISAPVSVNVVVVPPPPPPPASDNGYVQIVWVGGVPSAPVAAAFEAARQKINGLFNSFNGVVPVNPGLTAGYCLAGSPAVSQTVNGIVIFAQVTPIDGVGNILGSAGPCILRSGSLLPIVAAMQFDSADMDAMVASGMLNGVVLHEMMHTLGFGTIWQPGFKGEVAAPDGADPRYLGTAGQTQYAALGASDAATGVPVENTGGSGTRGSHWRESVFNSELMTGWANGSMAMSRVTIGALQDFGYDVNLNKADPYILGADLMAGESNVSQQIVEVTIRPIGVLGGNGKITPYQPQ